MTTHRLLALSQAGFLLLAGVATTRSVDPSSSYQSAADRHENAYRANNLGVALLEQFNYDEAASSFRRALEIEPELAIARLNLAIASFYANNTDSALAEARAAEERFPSAPQTHYLLGLIARAQDRAEDAAAAFKRVLQIDPSDVGSKVNLGQVYLQQRKFQDAIAMFRDALDAEAFNVTAAYGLATALIRSGAADEGRAAMQRFQSLRDSAYGVTYSQTYLEQGVYGEAIASTGAEPELVDPAPPPVTFEDATGAAGLPAARATPSGGGGSITLFDVDGDGDLDVFATNTSGYRLYRNESGKFSDVTASVGLSESTDVAAAASVSADYDNDGRADLFLLRAGGNRLLHQGADGRFEDVTAAAGIVATDGLATSAAFVDVDHDGDLDIFVVGASKEGAGAARNQLLRNNGKGTFTDITAAAGVGDGSSHGIAVAPTDFDNRRDIDLLVVGSGGPPRLFQNMRDGSFHDVSGKVGLPQAASYSALAVADLNKDGYPDFFFGRPDAPGVLAMSDGHGHFKTSDGPDASRGASSAQFVDYDNDGLLDLFIASRRAVRLFRNVGSSWSEVTDRAHLAALSAALTSDIQSIALGDLDRDGDVDAVVLLATGKVRYWRNDGGNMHRSLLVRLDGKVSNRGGIGSKVDLRAGSLRQRLETSAATPAIGPADTLFGLGARKAADVVRVIWPSGTLQAETDGEARVKTITELDRKPSSCPYLYTWNGSRFEFVTDFMGGGEIGYWEGPGGWNTPDPDEYVRIPAGRMALRNGRYELRVTNELEEALFVDRLELVAIDHLADVDVFPNEGLGAPASDNFFTTIRAARPPARAVDEHGHDVLPRLAALDRQYPDDFHLSDIRGYADPHELLLDIGPHASSAVLLATGWTDYAFSTDNVAAHQRGTSLVPPSLQVRSASASWRTIIPDIGIPVGRPQTVVVDLRGKLKAAEREVRILTNMRIYWDQILVDTSRGGAATRVTRIDPAVADLHWRGFSAEVTPDGREPYAYDYDRVSSGSPWKTMVGRYTREGDVRKLLSAVDDMFVIARPGDEIALAFDSTSLPALEPGFSRTFLLYANGFSKEMDVNSASPDTILPLPFHAMRRYPYGPDEHYPATSAHDAYRDRYNTRIVRRAVPPLETSGGR